ncbi:DUF1501 domain-containing protein [Lignipirellula cremea]|uniref:DUF1501 domain-containing protein n=1 Tax=Lignipirellula cremea TaxID=2528010 RepID=A0A518DS53_9BACT|nr:DUF1501 domain-containing protein [Lignipirellula cremea]QDU94663.1 hypothetical protein Pla8534_24690 [Lignipirellula cremea]
MTRRSLLQIGAMTLGGLSLADLLRLRADASPTPRRTAVIFVFLQGGPSQLETYDPKPDAPIEIRGPLDAIATRTPGVHLGEYMQQQARISDKLAIIRSLHHQYEASTNHRAASHLIQTGYIINPDGRSDELPRNPGAGAVAAASRGANSASLPAYVLMQRRSDGGKYAGGSYLGNAYDPFTLSDDPSTADFSVQNLSPPPGLSIRRISDRRHLLQQLDQVRRTSDAASASSDPFQQRAFDMVTGGGAQKAFDLSQEPERMRQRYGMNRTGQSFLLARRLVEAGVTFVQVMPPGGSGGGWDDHDGILQPMKIAGPAYDQGLATLISDLHDRGLNQDVLVVAMGEFGRSPRINVKRTGRDHWPNVFSALIAGGDYRMGQVIGSSNDKAEVPTSAPYQPQNVLAMIYRHLGIDPGRTYPDHFGRPRYILEEREPIRELL